MNRSYSQSNRGFALLLTLVLVSVIGVVAFGVGRLTLTEFRQSVRFQDSQDALQAAEGGIEDGLLRFRFNRDVEVPVVANCKNAEFVNPGTANDVPVPTDTTPYILRVNMTTGKYQCIDPTKTAAPLADEHVYDLKIYYKGHTLGNFNKIDDPLNPKLKKDEFLKSDLDPAGIDIKAALNLENNQVRSGSTFLHGFQIVFYDKDDRVVETQLIDQASDNKFNSALGATIQPRVGSSATKFSIKPIDQEADHITIRPVVTSKVLDFGITYIQVTGYSNGVKRSLTTLINRSTGTTQGIFNYVLFSGNGEINTTKPTPSP